jgi:hypothetical protein
MHNSYFLSCEGVHEDDNWDYVVLTYWHQLGHLCKNPRGGESGQVCKKSKFITEKRKKQF